VAATKFEKSFADRPISPPLRIALRGDRAVPAYPHELMKRVARGARRSEIKASNSRYPGIIRIAIPLVGSSMLWAAIIWGVAKLL
jgi:hypothetical protein